MGGAEGMVELIQLSIVSEVQFSIEIITVTCSCSTIQEGYKPKSAEDRGYTPLSQKPTGQTPTFTPPSGGSGAPSDGGGSQSEPASNGGDSGGSEE